MEMTVLAGKAVSEYTVNARTRYYLMLPVAVELVSTLLSPRSVIMEKDALDDAIEEVCLMVGVPAHIQGFQFIGTAVRMVLMNPDIINRITRDLYPGIARRHRTTDSKVERSIRHAVTVLWTRGRVENINKMLGFEICSSDSKPTNGEFIALLARICRMNGVGQG